MHPVTVLGSPVRLQRSCGAGRRRVVHLQSHNPALVEVRARKILLSAGAEYVDFLNSVTPDNQDEYLLQMRRFNLGPVGEADCPVFDGMFEYCAVGLSGITFCAVV